MKKLQYMMSLSLIFGFLLSFANVIDSERTETIISIAINNDKEIMKAAFVGPGGYAYFFRERFIPKYDIRNDRLIGIGEINKGGWSGVESNIDAAMMHPSNGKAYFFRGNTYLRYDFNKRKIDKKGIVGVDGWKGLNGPFDAVVARPKSTFSYFFKGRKVYRYNHSKRKMDKESTIGSGGEWIGVPSNPDLALAHINDKFYFFKGDHYYRYNWITQKVDKKGIIGRNGWKGLFKKVDAANEGEFFRGAYNYYIGTAGKMNAPWYLKTGFGNNRYPGVPPNVDAALRHPTNNKLYFFKGDKYYRFIEYSRKVDKTGTIGRDGWKGVPKNIDAAFSTKKYAYFFKEEGVYIYKYADKTGYMMRIKNYYRGAPDYIDAVDGTEDKVYIYKKSTKYVYDEAVKKTIHSESIPEIVLK